MNKLIFITALVAIISGCLINGEEMDIPEDFIPIQQNIYERLITPEDNQVQRDIKSLFAQYILVAAMNAANTSENSPPVAPVSPPQQQYQPPPPPPIQAAAAEPVAPPPQPQQQQQQQQLQQQQTFVPDTLQQSIISQQQQDIAVPTTLPPPPVETLPPQTVPILIPAPTAAPPAVPILPAAATPEAPTLPPVTLRPRPSTEHVLNQVDKILGSVAIGNITGIVDQSLQINTSKPVQNLVTGILNTIFCTPINRLLGRCRG
ncbi:classical arabinogalactan protein 9 isoform X2 [Folsomia candida]|uniref:classical arabinogalactan protein 9 isoform X2 n=1 Tax=Folsomia candida TaxID=158441 RepID=UPI000B8F0246|nr:classical arabinogalactan protein 9 isoform X2 [Folsomia candida]